MADDLISSKINPTALATSAAHYRSELLKMPVLGLGQALRFFTLRTGIRYSETVGELSGSIELAPYDEQRVEDDDIEVKGRTLYTFFGDVVKNFSPNNVVQSIYGSSITSGEGLKNVDIVRQVLAFLSAKVGRGLAVHLFDAVRNAKGSKTKDLFNGFDTITSNEIKAGNLSAEAGNLFEFSEAITAENAVDMLSAFCQAASDELLENFDGETESQASGLLLYVPRSIVYAYNADYKATTGHSPVYDKFNQTSVEGFPNIKFVPMAAKAKSPFIHLSTRQNMLIGVDQMPGSKETLTVEKHHAFLLQFILTMFFGAEFESINKERLLVGKLYSAPAKEPENNPSQT